MPVLPIVVHGVKNRMPARAIVDSGADYSFIPITFAQHLGVDPAQCVQERCNTAGGVSTLYIWQAGLEAEIQQMRMRIHLKTAFSETPFVLLGREDFFNAFKVAFDQRAQRFTLERYS